MAYILSMATLKARRTKKKNINRENDFLNQNSVLNKAAIIWIEMFLEMHKNPENTFKKNALYRPIFNRTLWQQ